MKKNCFNCFKTIAVKTRFQIFNFLKNHPRVTVNNLVKLTSLRQPTVTFHINQLSKKGLLKKSKVGRFVFCQLHQRCHPCPLFN